MCPTEANNTQERIRSLIGFSIYLSVFFLANIVLIYIGTLIAEEIYALVGLDAMGIRQLMIIVTATLLGGGGILFILSFYCLTRIMFLMMGFSAATWLGAIGPVNLILNGLAGAPVTWWLFEAWFTIIVLNISVVWTLAPLGKPLCQRYLKSPRG